MKNLIKILLGTVLLSGCYVQHGNEKDPVIKMLQGDWNLDSLDLKDDLNSEIKGFTFFSASKNTNYIFLRRNGQQFDNMGYFQLYKYSPNTPYILSVNWTHTKYQPRFKLYMESDSVIAFIPLKSQKRKGINFGNNPVRLHKNIIAQNP